jgi:hypothetical protein
MRQKIALACILILIAVEAYFLYDDHSRQRAGLEMRPLPAPGSGAPKDGFCRQQKSPSSQDFGGR